MVPVPAARGGGGESRSPGIPPAEKSLVLRLTSRQVPGKDAKDNGSQQQQDQKAEQNGQRRVGEEEEQEGSQKNQNDIEHQQSAAQLVGAVAAAEKPGCAGAEFVHEMSHAGLPFSQFFSIIGGNYEQI